MTTKNKSRKTVMVIPSLRVANRKGGVVNVTPTYHTEDNPSETSYVPRVTVNVYGKAMWNFFAFRSLLLLRVKEATEQGIWERSTLERFCNACEHARTHGALRFVAEGFSIVLVMPPVLQLPFCDTDKEEEE